MMKKSILMLCLLLLNTSTSYAFCILGIGRDCPRGNQQNRDEANNQVYKNNYQSNNSYSREKFDGGNRRELQKGDKSLNQGYAEYRENFFLYEIDLISSPHQEAKTARGETFNRSFAYEYAFNPFVSVKVQRTELEFEGFTSKEEKGNEISDETYTHLHHMALVVLRLYLKNNLVIRGGAGIGLSDLEREWKVGGETKKKKYSGQTMAVQVSLNYLFGDEDIFVGLVQTTIEGQKENSANLGASYYGINFGFAF